MTVPDDFRPIDLYPSGEPAYRAFLDAAPITGTDGRATVYCPLTGRAVVVDHTDLTLLSVCGTFAPLSVHATNGATALGLPYDPTGRLLARLGALAAAGFLVREDEALTRSDTAYSPPPAVSVIGIPTRDRPDILARCLADLAASLRASYRAVEVVVADSSPTSDGQTATRRALQHLGGAASGIAYAGPAERERYVAALAGTGADLTAARFALLPDPDFTITTGANRNLLALHAAGRCLLHVDDDTLSRTAAVPGAGAELVLTRSGDPTEFWFLPEIPRYAPDLGVQTDVAGVHEQLLGRGPGQWTAFSGRPIDSNGADAALFSRLRVPDARVRVTTAGVAGDSGMGATRYYLLFADSSRERLHASIDTYRTAVGGGGVIRAATRPTVTVGSVCMGLNLGLDLRAPLAPFPPVLRNSDGVFAAVVASCCPGALSGHLPSAVWHLPPTDRPARPDPLGSGAGTRAEYFLLYFVRACAPPLATADERRNFRILGDGLIGIGELPPAEFAAVVREAGWELLRSMTAHLHARLDEYRGEPAWWAADVRRLVDHFRDSAAREHFAVPVDLLTGGDASTALARLQRAIGGYGHLLVHWHDLVAAATDLRARGVMPAPPVAS